MGEIGIHIFTSSCVNDIIKKYSHNVSAIITPNRERNIKSRALVNAYMAFNDINKTNKYPVSRSGQNDY